MTPFEAITALRGLLHVAAMMFSNSDSRLGAWSKTLAQIVNDNNVEGALKLTQEVAGAIKDHAGETARIHAAALKNPAIAIQPALLVLLLVLCLGATACGGAVRHYDASPGLRAHYGVVWPAGASTNPADYQTTMEGGRMVTTAPATVPPTPAPVIQGEHGDGQDR